MCVFAIVHDRVFFHSRHRHYRECRESPHHLSRDEAFRKAEGRHGAFAIGPLERLVGSSSECTCSAKPEAVVALHAASKLPHILWGMHRRPQTIYRLKICWRKSLKHPATLLILLAKHLVGQLAYLLVTKQFLFAYDKNKT